MLLSIAKADDILDNDELKSISDILIDFFQLSSKDQVDNLIEKASNELEQSTDIFEF